MIDTSFGHSYYYDYVAEAFPAKLSFHLFSDDVYRKLWLENWGQTELKKWWEKIDPKSYFPSNPFNENGYEMLSFGLFRKGPEDYCIY